MLLRVVHIIYIKFFFSDSTGAFSCAVFPIMCLRFFPPKCSLYEWKHKCVVWYKLSLSSVGVGVGPHRLSNIWRAVQ